ncbi:MAG: nucleoside-diphosphate kinase [Bacteroidales bacterium]|jgi:nucleoside-diphosphate kinase|nr:nucleoside-diphosphate kinase [Bacteroidales bacterium]
METTFVILKPGTVQRGLIGEVINRFERKGLQLVGMKLQQLTPKILTEHYSHLASKSFFPAILASMMASPVVLCCWRGVDAVRVVRSLCGVTNSRDALPGTIRGDYGMSVQENVVHASDSVETAIEEVKRFFKPEEIFEYSPLNQRFVYSSDELSKKD